MPNVMAAQPNARGALCWMLLIKIIKSQKKITKPKRETCWNLLGCPKLANRSQTLVGRSSAHCNAPQHAATYRNVPRVAVRWGALRHETHTHTHHRFLTYL